MKVKIILIMSVSVLALFSILGGSMVLRCLSNDYISDYNIDDYTGDSNIDDCRSNYEKIHRSSYRSNHNKCYDVFERNETYYYKAEFNCCGSLYRGVEIVFEDDLALICEHYLIRAEYHYPSIPTWKYIDKKGKVNLRLGHDVFRADAFSEGLAAVSLSQGMEAPHWGYIDKEGEFVIKPQYRRASMFKDGFASVFTCDRKWILINNKGEYIRDLDEPLNWKSYTQWYSPNPDSILLVDSFIPHEYFSRNNLRYGSGQK